MDISSVGSVALQGLEQANAQMSAAVSAIAGGGDGSSAAPTDVVSLSEEMVALMSAQTQYNASLDTVKVADQMQQNLINVMA